MGKALWACRRGLNTSFLSRSFSFFTDSSWTWKPWYWVEVGEEIRGYQNLDWETRVSQTP